jgi:DNA mismatch endonuclease, patch repair protein
MAVIGMDTDAASAARGQKAIRANWGPKIAGNKARDASSVTALAGLGWKVLIIWECETRDMGKLESRLRRFLK